MESANYRVYRINTKKSSYGYYDDTIYVMYLSDEEGNRILEDDIVTVYGEYTGLYSYESVMGATITIPSMYAQYIAIQ